MNEFKYKVGDMVYLTQEALDINELENRAYKIEYRMSEVRFSYLIEVPGYQYWLSEEQIERKQPASLDDALTMVKETPTKKRLMTLPTDSAKRKEFPVLSGFLKYFPAAVAGVSNTSKLGNDKHNPGQELHHDRSKSMDHGDCIVRHLMDVEDLISAQSKGKDVTTEAILLEVNQMVWRALAYSQELHERYGAPLAPSAKKEEGK